MANTNPYPCCGFNAPVSPVPPLPSEDIELREDGGFELREDNGYELEEDGT